MFCTNCGSQNNDEVLNCQKCGFKLKESPASKFKGTMLMMNAPANIQALQQAAPPAAPAPTAPVPVAPTGPMPGSPVAGSVAANAPAPAVTAKANFKGTMIGVAPPSLTGPAAPVAPAAGAAPHNFSHAPSTTPASPGAIGAGAPPPMSPVNPLGGTLVAGDKRQLGVADVAINMAPNAPAPTGPMGAPGPAAHFGGDAFGSTLPSGKDAPAFASTTPSAGNAPPHFGNAPQGGTQPTQPMAQAASPGASQGVLITLIVILVVSLAALVWTVLR